MTLTVLAWIVSIVALLYAYYQKGIAKTMAAKAQMYHDRLMQVQHRARLTSDANMWLRGENRMLQEKVKELESALASTRRADGDSV